MNNITCPCCGGNKATQVNENEFRCEYCGNTFTVSRPEPVQQQVYQQPVNPQQVYQQPANQQPMYQQPVGQEQYVADYAVGDMQELEEEHSNPIVHFLLKYKWYIIGLTLLIIIGNFAEKSNNVSMEDFITGTWTSITDTVDIDGVRNRTESTTTFEKDKTFVEEGKSIIEAIIDGEKFSYTAYYKTTGTWSLKETTVEGRDITINKTKKKTYKTVYNLEFFIKDSYVTDITSEQLTEEGKAELKNEYKDLMPQRNSTASYIIEKDNEKSMTLKATENGQEISTFFHKK